MNEWSKGRYVNRIKMMDVGTSASGFDILTYIRSTIAQEELKKLDKITKYLALAT